MQTLHVQYPETQPDRQSTLFVTNRTAPRVSSSFPPGRAALS